MNLSVMKDLVANHKRALLTPVVLVAVFVLGFGAAKFASPAKVLTKTQIVTQVQTKVVTEVQYKDRVVVKRVYVKQKRRDQHIDTTVTKEANGTTITHTVVDNHDHSSSSSDSSSQTDKQKNASQTQQQVLTQTVYKEKLVLSQPNWSAHVGIGYSIPYLLGESTQGIPGLHGIVIAGGISRRILGPVWLGVWGDTQGVVGANVRVSW